MHSEARMRSAGRLVPGTGIKVLSVGSQRSHSNFARYVAACAPCGVHSGAETGGHLGVWRG
eukprot:9292947-Pyramimonas_sp.AAC.1